MLALDEPVGRQATGRRARRPSRRQQTPVALEDVQATAFEDLSRANLTYADFYTELSSQGTEQAARKTAVIRMYSLIIICDRRCLCIIIIAV